MLASTLRCVQLVLFTPHLRLLTHLVRLQSSSATAIGESISVRIPPIPLVLQPAGDNEKLSPIKPAAKAKSVPSTVLSYYYDTARPNAAQLRQADKFFRAHSPSILFSAGKFRTVKFTDVPEVAFLGRSNVGKSTLLNALMGQPICHTSRHPGRTKTMNGFAVGGPDGMGHPGRLTVLDMPGYGHGSREEWGSEIVKYLVGRKEYGAGVISVCLMIADIGIDSGVHFFSWILCTVSSSQMRQFWLSSAIMPFRTRLCCLRSIASFCQVQDRKVSLRRNWLSMRWSYSASWRRSASRYSQRMTARLLWERF